MTTECHIVERLEVKCAKGGCPFFCFLLVRLNLRCCFFDINMKALDFTKEIAIPVCVYPVILRPFCPAEKNNCLGDNVVLFYLVVLPSRYLDIFRLNRWIILEDVYSMGTSLRSPAH